MVLQVDIFRKLNRHTHTQADEIQAPHSQQLMEKVGWCPIKKVCHDLDFTKMGIKDVIARLRAGAGSRPPDQAELFEELDIKSKVGN
jgi:hypothetical protein